MDYESGMLPTLDYQTRVLPDGQIGFKYYSKPMTSGLVIMKGTTLSRQTIFSSLRQDLIRRLSNMSNHFQLCDQIEVIENFIRSLVNSGHKYKFIRSIILQALTRMKFIKERASLEKENVRFKPMYRSKMYDFDTRCKLKCTNKTMWYSGKLVGDKFNKNGREG